MMAPLQGSERTLGPDDMRRRDARPLNLPLDSSEIIKVTVLLRSDPEGPELPEAPTRDQLLAARRPSPREVDEVVAFAEANHLEVVERDRPPRMVVLSGTVEDMTRAFGTHVERWEEVWRDAPRQFRLRPDQPLQVPEELDGKVEGVFGIDNRKEARMQMHLHPGMQMHRGPGMQMHLQPGMQMHLVDGAVTVDPELADAVYTVPEVCRRYDFPDGDGSGETIAILALEGRFDRRELEEYCGTLDLPTPDVIDMEVDSGRPEAGEEPDGDVETMLDVHVAAASAWGARIGVCHTSNTAQGLVNGLARIIYDSELDASVCSLSYGDYAATWSPQARKAVGSLLEDAALLGITVCCASGDFGSSDGAPDPDSKHVDFPAEHPLALGCGGTRLGPHDDKQQPGLLEEVVWRDGRLGSGGGESEEFERPEWQQGRGLEGWTRRGVPDVAGNADPKTGYAIRIREHGGLVIGGTSPVAPLWAGLIARINQRLGRRLGHVTPLLYEIDARAFHDIEHGSNGAYDAGIGWDACTGLGRPSGNALLEELSRKLGLPVRS